jgi:hypothetical protein
MVRNQQMVDINSNQEKTELPQDFFYFAVGPFQDQELFPDETSFIDYMLMLRWKSGVRRSSNDSNLSGINAIGFVAR